MQVEQAQLPNQHALHVDHILTVTAQLAAGEREWLRGSLSNSTEYRLLIKGAIGSKQIARLIKLLEVQKAVLDDDDDELS